MSDETGRKAHYAGVTLDSVKYEPDDEAKEFFKLETGITDDEELKEHILAVRAKAFPVSLVVRSCAHVDIDTRYCRSSNIHASEYSSS